MPVTPSPSPSPNRVLKVKFDDMLSYLEQTKRLQVRQATATDNGYRTCWTMKASGKVVTVKGLSNGQAAPTQTYAWDLVRLQFDLEIWNDSRGEQSGRFVKK